tara:strand:+ start:29 stop:316 length:288 start_codon:yes stop_codon:yes gene_type:complete
MRTINVDINLDLEVSEEFYKEWQFDKNKKTFAHATENRKAHLFPEVIDGPESLLHLVSKNVFRNNTRRINSVTAKEIPESLLDLVVGKIRRACHE